MLIALYVITIINVLVAAGFAIAGLVRPVLVAPGQQTEASRVFALYTFARTIPVALVTIAAMLRAQVVVVLWLSALAGLIQLFDGYVGTQLKNPARPGAPSASRCCSSQRLRGWSSALRRDSYPLDHPVLHAA